MREFCKKYDIDLSDDCSSVFTAAKEELLRRGADIFDFEKHSAFTYMNEDIKRLRDSLAEDPDNLLYSYILVEALRRGESKLVTEISHPKKAQKDEKYDILPIFAILDLIPDMLSEHKRRGIPENISRDTVMMIENQAQDFIDLNHRFGISDYVGWLWGFLRGDIIRIGRFNFEITKYTYPYVVFERDGELFSIPIDTEKNELKARGSLYFRPILRGGEQVVSVHIPTGGPFPPEVCDRDFGIARAIIAKSYGGISAFVCHSWLLDPKIKELLGKETNLTRFADRFLIMPAKSDGADVYEYVWQKKEPCDPCELDESTSLKRAIKAHLVNGGYICGSYGVFI